MNLTPVIKQNQLMISGSVDNFKSGSIKFSEKMDDSRVFNMKRIGSRVVNKNAIEPDENPLKKFADSFTSIQIEKVNEYRVII